jgi:zinc protease
MSYRAALLATIASVAACSGVLGAQTRLHVQRASAPPDIAYTRFTLANGLTLLVHEDHKAPIAAVNVWYHVGSKNEQIGKTGFAHLFEHLFFGGSEHATGVYIKQLEQLGATDLNGTTNNDRTNFFETIPITALDRVLFLESDRMGHLMGSVDTARLTLQRGVVQNEKRQSENLPYGKADITIAENTFPRGHPYSWSVIGSMDDLDAASMKDVREWFETYYGPANAVLVVAGDVNAEDVHRRVDRYFGDIPSGPPIVKQQGWIAKMQGEHRQIMQDRVPQPRLYKVWNIPEYGSADATYLTMALDILGRGTSSRLYKRLVYRDRIATDVDAATDEREIASQAAFVTTAQPGGDLRAVERAQDEELRTFIASGPTPIELDREKAQRRTLFVRGTERVGGFGGKSDILAESMVYGGSPDAYKAQQLRIANATSADLRIAAKRWLSDGDYVLEVHPFPSFSTVASTVDRSKLPDVGPPPAAPLPTPERATLSNGMKVVLLQRRGVPFVRVQAIVEGGFAADAPSRPGVANTTMQMITQGTTSRSALQIQDEIASLGADFYAWSDLDVSSIRFYSLTNKLAPAMTLLADVLQHPSFPTSDLDRVKQITLATIKQEEVDPRTVGLRVLPPVLYGSGHAYSQPLTGSGTEASVRAMTRTDLIKFHQSWFKPNHTTIVAAGDVSMPAFKAQLEHVFAGWAPGDIPAKNIANVASATGHRVYILDRPGADQSVIIGAQLIAPRADAEDIPFQLFNDAFGGAFGSRINMNLREDKHWSYGTWSFAQDARGQRLWMIYAPVQTDKTKESLSEVAKELQSATGDRPLTGGEISLAKDRTIKTLAGRWETNREVGAALSDIEIYGLPKDYYATYPDILRNSTDAQINAAAKKFLDPNRIVWLVVGDRAKIEADIKTLNLGDVVELTANGPKSMTP